MPRPTLRIPPLFPLQPPSNFQDSHFAYNQGIPIHLQMAHHLTRRPRLFLRVHPESGSRSERVRSRMRAGLEGLEVSDGCGQDGVGSSGESDELADDLGHARLAERVGKGKSRAGNSLLYYL
jgi:hypothetical protein